jgi:hypothetical protein
MITAWIRCCRPLLAVMAMLGAVPAHAHKASDAYLLLNADGAASTLRIDVALRDLDAALDIDADADGRITWGEVRAAWPAIERYVRAHVQVAGCEFGAATRALERRADGAYAALTLSGTCRGAGAPAIRYTMLDDVDPTHRGIARIAAGAAAPAVRVLDPTRPQALAAVLAPPPSSFLAEGIRHIVTGYDHVLFLMCLLLPSVMRRTPSGWQPVQRLSEALLPVLAIVTAFTLAHSITLALAALQLASLPPSFIEPAIAATIVLAAFDNVRPIFRGPRALVTFAFGLVHGFGFAGVLAELDLPASRFAWALLQFNLGLELGQVAIVAVAIGVLFLLRERRRYAAWLLRGGSLAAMAIGLAWFIERTADVSLLPL